MSGREESLSAFLARQGCDAAPPSLLAGDASFRKYYRVTREQRALVLMDAPPPEENVRPFMAVAGYLSAQGFSAPGILAADKDAGLLLLEDLGDDSFNRVITATPGMENTLYEAAIDLLVALHSIEPPAEIKIDDQESHSLAPYDAELLLQEAALFTQWYLPALTGTSEGKGEGEADQALADLLRPLLQPLLADRQVLVLRDYHADNLMWLAARQGIARLAVLDFQDAVIGHRAYDLVSLLQDARRDVPEGLEAAMIGRYLDAMDKAGNRLDAQAFRRAYALLGAQRNAKIIGIFTRLWKRDKKPGYLAMIPRVWGLLARSLEHEDLADLRAFFDARVPREARVIAPNAETMPR